MSTTSGGSKRSNRFLRGRGSVKGSKKTTQDLSTKPQFKHQEYSLGFSVSKEALHDLSTNVVNHPPHYNTGKIEVIDFIEDQKLGFHLGNVVKYVCRKTKYGTEETFPITQIITDLKKAVWYLQREISNLEKIR